MSADRMWMHGCEVIGLCRCSRGGEVVLVDRGEDTHTQLPRYVTGYRLHLEDDEWTFGVYFTDLMNAIRSFSTRCEGILMADLQDRDVTLLLGAEGWSENESQSWLRKPTEEEIAAFITEIGGEKRYHELTLDGTGRPYWPAVVSKDAPEDIWLVASCRVRTLRFGRN